MKLIKFFSTGAFIVLTACAMQKISINPQQSLYDSKWNLKKIYSGTNSDEVITKAFIRFNKEKGSAGGNGGCNTFGSNAAVTNDQVSFSNIFSTKMYCEGIQSSEDAFLKQLANVNRFEINNKTLRLYHDKEELLEFQAGSN